MTDSRFTIHDSPYRLVYILGAGHCGSTLLDMMLGRHSRIFAGGEIGGIHRYWAIATGHETPMIERTGHQTDWLEVASHPFASATWRAVVRCYEETTGTSFETARFRHPSWGTLLFRPDAAATARWARPQRTLFDCLHTVTGRPLITDASKRPQRLYRLWQSGVFDLMVIHLIRDGRGIMHSYLSKYGRWGPSFRRWAGPTVMSFYLRRVMSGIPWLDVRYEDLARSPERTLERICGFLAIPYEPAMLEFREYEYLGIGGNRMREDEGGIVLDERWKHDWRGPGRVAFSVAGGWLNRLCGY
jgi:hypothetical protein